MRKQIFLKRKRGKSVFFVSHSMFQQMKYALKTNLGGAVGVGKGGQCGLFDFKPP